MFSEDMQLNGKDDFWLIFLVYIFSGSQKKNVTGRNQEGEICCYCNGWRCAKVRHAPSSNVTQHRSVLELNGDVTGRSRQAGQATQHAFDSGHQNRAACKHSEADTSEHACPIQIRGYLPRSAAVPPPRI